MANLVQEASVCIFLDLGFNFHLKFWGWSKNKTEKNRTGNFDTFLDITFLLLELLKNLN
jgi:hypothetical protein